MPDPLDRAVDAQIDAFRPDTVPPFAAIETRKRARDRRRNSRAAVLSALSVVGVLGVVFAGPSLTGGGGDRVTGPPVAGPAATPTASVDDRATTRYELRYVDGLAYDAERDGPLLDVCLALPGTSEVGVKLSLPSVYTVLLTGSERAAAFERCAVALENVAIRNLDAAPSGSLWTGVRVCRTQPTGPCQELDADTANRIYDALALDSRPPVDSNGVRCQPLSVTYTLLFHHPAKDVGEITVPAASCLPVTVGVSDYAVDDSPRELVRQAYDAAVDRGPVDPCLAADPSEPGYVGLTEQQARDLAARQGLTVRVVGRDGTCGNLRTDLRGDRVDLDLVNGRVASATRS